MPINHFEKLIGFSRFPLICLVALIHSLGFSLEPVRLTDFSTENAYNFVTQMLSHNYAQIAVCLFFFYSGYLIFKGFESFSWKWCIGKWKKRIHSLLIPFILWNLIAVFAVVIKNYMFGIFGSFDLEEMGIFSWNNILNWFRTPADFPLWYIEDLMLMVLIIPVIWFLIEKLGKFFPLLLLLVYLSPIDPGHISMKAIFFPIGAYCSITKTDVYRICRIIRIPCHILAIATLLIATFNNSTDYHELLLRVFFPFGMISFLNLLDTATAKRVKYGPKLEVLAGSSFFIYAVHEIYILGWTKGICLRVFGESIPAMYVRYFLVPIIVVTVCLFLYQLLRRFTPKTLSVLCGGRIS